MRETTGRLLRAKAWDRPNAFAVITEAVWWVTMVDATLVRYHADTYNGLLAACDAPDRKSIEDTFTGLRFVRNRMGYEADHDDFIQAQATGAGHPAALIAAWTWKPIPELALIELPPRGVEWEQSRHRAYQAQLAFHLIGDTFRCAADFLQLAAEGRTGQD
jgi:hypothetical protein